LGAALRTALVVLGPASALFDGSLTC
jgi:hypothetical protein